MRPYLLALVAVGCVHRAPVAKPSSRPSARLEIYELRCQVSTQLLAARDEQQAKNDRHENYSAAITDAKATADKFEAAFRREPDLIYGTDGDEWKHRQRECEALASTLEAERAGLEVAPTMKSTPTRVERIETAPGHGTKKGKGKSRTAKGDGKKSTLLTSR